MKKLSTILIILLLSGCVSEREFIVESDYSYRGKFKRYDSFDFLDLGDTVHFNGLSDNMIKREIERRLIAQGYKRKENPSIYIAYKVFSDDMKFKGYEQMDLENWDTQFAERAENENNLEYIREARYINKNYQLQKGTLLIDFIDRKSHGVIWQGYASGLFDDSNYFSKDVRYSVRSILNEYRLVALGYQ